MTNNQLPSKSYSELIGRDDVLNEITTALRDPSDKWIIAIDGIGGIGKTTLAREIADHCISKHLFDTVVWDQAPKEFEGLPTGLGKGEQRYTFDIVLDSIARQLGVLDILRLKQAEKEGFVRKLLQDRRVLIVLDNLETAEESQNEIARRLLPLLNPSKAVMTSRHRFQGDVYAVHLSGLDEDASIRFIRREARTRGFQNLSSASALVLKQIAETTGGSPLALKIVIGQSEYLPLETVLESLRRAEFPRGESSKYANMRSYRAYGDIFLPSWQLLSENGQQLLIAMSHFAVDMGGDFEAVRTVSGLDLDALSLCIDELKNYSLIDVRKHPQSKQTRYCLDRLLRDLVLSDVVQIAR